MYLAGLTKSLGIRLRLTLVYSTLFGLFICIFAYITSAQFVESGRADFDSALLNYAIDLSSQVHYDQSGLKVDLNVPRQELKKQFPFLLKNTYYFLRELNGKILLRVPHDGNLQEIPYKTDLALKEDYTHRFLSLQDKDSAYRAVNLKLTDDKGRVLILQVASPSSILEEQVDRLLLVNVITIPLLILISSIASFLIAGNALTPVKNLIETANKIAASNLSSRVPIPESNDEIAHLSKTFNNLLERLEKAFKGQEHFVANASHQLNTPLSIIKGELQVLESKARTPEEINRFHQSLREELDRLIDLVKNLLMVSRVEAGMENFIFHDVRMDELLLNISARLRPKKREKNITLRFNISDELEAEDVMIKGEKQLLDCLFENLLENAIKYSPAFSTLRIDLAGNNKVLEVRIQDEGPGINEEELHSILSKRFQRGTKMMIPGTGIGLSLAYQIAEYHKATIKYQRVNDRGSLFIICFPK